MRPEPDAIPASAGGTLACLQLLVALQDNGLKRLVLCPGSRSAPLAVAASLRESAGLVVHTAIDERSAAFFALGLARAEGQPVAVVTTSGSAVANLLPALVEADRSTLPLLLLTADRPARLKNCGANQTVNQEAFLLPCCRWVGQGDPRGLATMTSTDLLRLGSRAMAKAAGNSCAPAGPVHLNLPLEEPLHPDASALAWLKAWQPPGARIPPAPEPPPGAAEPPQGIGDCRLDPDQPGVVIAGPWRGAAASWGGHLAALAQWQRRSGWPVLADVLSGLQGRGPGPLVAGYDLLLEAPPRDLAAPQVLRLGPLPASRRLERWLAEQGGPQVLVSEGDPRPMDPLRKVRGHWPHGLASWPVLAAAAEGFPAPGSLALARHWREGGERVQRLLHSCCPPPGGATALEPIDEPWLARELSRQLPAGLGVMLANSSPVRDWESFADPDGPGRAIHSFRGASGIDGTLSIACGLAESLGQLVLVSGDLALQHDSNGWLWHRRIQGRLLVLVIDNGGGGIFEQLPIRTDPGDGVDFDRLFAMPQGVDPCALAAAHGVPGRMVRHKGDLAAALAWGLEQPMALLRVISDRRADATRRRQLRTMAAELFHP